MFNRVGSMCSGEKTPSTSWLNDVRQQYRPVSSEAIYLASDGTELSQRPDAKLAPLDIRVKPAPPVPVSPAKRMQAGPSLKNDFARVIRAEITRSDLGYHLLADK